ncbi:MAG: hypothetical protein ABSE90_11785, partial [Verrucomicrobiota bacterium]
MSMTFGPELRNGNGGCFKARHHWRAAQSGAQAHADVLWFASGVFIKVVHKVWVGCSLVQVSEPR